MESSSAARFRGRIFAIRNKVDLLINLDDIHFPYIELELPLG